MSRTKRTRLGRLGWVAAFSTVVAVGVATLALAGQAAQKSKSADLAGAKGEPLQIRAEDVGKSVTILGKLGKPLGELVTVRGKWVVPPGPVKDDTPAFHVFAIDGRPPEKSIVLPGMLVEPFFDTYKGRANAGNWTWKFDWRGKDLPPDAVHGQVWEMIGVENAHSRINSDKAWEEIGNSRVPAMAPAKTGFYTTFEFIGVRIIEGGK